MITFLTDLHPGIAEMATEQLTLDKLMDLLCDYRKTVGGNCQIVMQYADAGAYAYRCGLIHAVYVERDSQSPRDLPPLHCVLPLGVDTSAFEPAAAPQVALCLRPYHPQPAEGPEAAR